MAKAAGNLQDSVLNQLRKENVEVEFFFLSGKSLRGVVRGFDNFTIIVKDAEGHHHLVYKHAVSHVASSKPFTARQPGREAQKPQDAPRGEAPAHDGEAPAREAGEKKKAKEPFNRIDLSQIKVNE